MKKHKTQLDFQSQEELIRRKNIKSSSGEHTTFDKLSFPPVIYKYREANDSLHRTLLADQVTYFTPPNTFKYKLDRKSSTCYDLLTDDEIFDLYLGLFKEIHPEWGPLVNKLLFGQIQDLCIIEITV